MPHEKRAWIASALAAITQMVWWTTGLGATPPTVETRVEQAAREQLTTFAERIGLRSPTIKINLLRGSRQAETSPCAGNVEVQAVDTRSFTRMRFAGICGTDPGRRVEFVVRAILSAEVVVAASAVRAGTAISAADVLVERREVAGGIDAVSDIDAVVGKAATRTLSSGAVISRHWLVEPLLVKRGDAVTIIARHAGVEVEVAGEAMDAGHRDAIVRVRNVANGKIIRARVKAEHTVEPEGLPP